MSRFITNWKPAGSKTFRLASKQQFGYGGNAQNWEKILRKQFIADPGKVLIQCDQAGAEAVIVSYLTPNMNYRRMFKAGIKSHVFVALHAFKERWAAEFGDISEYLAADVEALALLPRWKEMKALISESDNWPAAERYYFIAKMICHASNYGMGAHEFTLNALAKSEGSINLTKAQAQAFLTLYHSLFPEIQRWHVDTIQQLKLTRTLYNFFGYPRTFHGPLCDRTYKDAYSFVPQSTVGVITHNAFVKMQNYIEENGRDWDLLNNCHDSYAMQVPEDEAQDAAKVMKPYLMQSITSHRGEQFVMGSDCKVGKNLYEMEDL